MLWSITRLHSHQQSLQESASNELLPLEWHVEQQEIRTLVLQTWLVSWSRNSQQTKAIDKTTSRRNDLRRCLVTCPQQHCHSTLSEKIKALVYVSGKVAYHRRLAIKSVRIFNVDREQLRLEYQITDHAMMAIQRLERC